MPKAHKEKKKTRSSHLISSHLLTTPGPQTHSLIVQQFPKIIKVLVNCRDQSLSSLTINRLVCMCFFWVSFAFLLSSPLLPLMGNASFVLAKLLRSTCYVFSPPTIIVLLGKKKWLFLMKKSCCKRTHKTTTVQFVQLEKVSRHPTPETVCCTHTHTHTHTHILYLLCTFESLWITCRKQQHSWTQILNDIW